MQADVLGPVDPDERVEVSMIVRPRRPLAELEARLDRPMTREEFAASYGADPADLSQVEAFARTHGLVVLESSAARRTVRVAGRAADVERAFGVRLVRQRLGDGTEFRSPDGPVNVPDELSGIVESIFGLDTRPAAREHE
jgi:kumamolisin